MQLLHKRMHKSTESIVTVPENCLIVSNCGLYHGQRKLDRKNKWKDIRMSFQLVNESLYNDKYYEDKATYHICQSSFTIFFKNSRRKYNTD